MKNMSNLKRFFFVTLFFCVTYNLLIYKNDIFFKKVPNSKAKTELIDVDKSNRSLNSKALLIFCPIIPPNIGTRIELNLKNESLNSVELNLRALNIKHGGFSQPSDCISRFKTAIILPYRNRQEQLNIFLRHIYPFLTKQQLDFGIYLVEPLEGLVFNRGLLLNIGFLESIKLSNNKWECFIYHDIDLLPEDERNFYVCGNGPRHMSSAVSTHNYKLLYGAIFGGVVAISKDQMLKVNGYSNLYFGWGGEDDDFRTRFVANNFTISRYPLEIGRYYMHKHERDQITNHKRHMYLYNTLSNMNIDGINSIKYETKTIIEEKLFTKIQVSYDQKEFLNSENLVFKTKTPVTKISTKVSTKISTNSMTPVITTTNNFSAIIPT